MDTFQSELGTKFEHTLEANHVISGTFFFYKNLNIFLRVLENKYHIHLRKNACVYSWNLTTRTFVPYSLVLLYIAQKPKSFESSDAS